MSPSPLGTQLPPVVAAWLDEALGANKQMYDSFEPYLQGLAAEREKLQGGLETGQAEEQALMQRGPQGPAPMESFAGRLFGGISQAIAPQMNGQALAEREIQGREEQAAQRHAIKLQRLMKINERMAERAEKIGDLETSAKLQRENLKMEKDAEARTKAMEFARQEREANNRAAHEQWQRTNAGNTQYGQYLRTELQVAQREKQAAYAAYDALIKDKEGKKNARAQQRELARIYANTNKEAELEIRARAWEASFNDQGIVDQRAFRRNLQAATQEAEANELAWAGAQVRGLMAQALQRNKVLTELDVVSAIEKLWQVENNLKGVPMSAEDKRVISRAYREVLQELGERAPATQTSAGGPALAPAGAIPGTLPPEIADAIGEAFLYRPTWTPDTTGRLPRMRSGGPF